MVKKTEDEAIQLYLILIRGKNWINCFTLKQIHFTFIFQTEVIGTKKKNVKPNKTLKLIGFIVCVWKKKEKHETIIFLLIFFLYLKLTVPPNLFFLFIFLPKHVFYSPTRDIFLNDEETGVLCKGILRAVLTGLKFWSFTQKTII